MIDLKNVSWGKLLIAAAMGIIPATLSYCKASDEAAVARSISRSENDAGYKALVESVRHLEMVVGAQQETLLLLAQRGSDHLGAGSGSGSAAAGSAIMPEAGSAATVAVDFMPLPDSPNEALRMQAMQAAAMQADKIEINTYK